MILVATAGDSVISGSFYANSPVTGNWEDYVARDLVAYVDANYRTVAGPEASAASWATRWAATAR